MGGERDEFMVGRAACPAQAARKWPTIVGWGHKAVVGHP